MSHHHHHHSESHSVSKIDQDENAVTKWLNKMESSLANPKTEFNIADFSNKEIQSINAYMKTHQNSLDRYEKFLPPVQIHDTKDTSKDAHKAVHKNFLPEMTWT